MIKEGATIIDVGINRIKDEETGKTKIVGDVDFNGMLRLCIQNIQQQKEFCQL